VSDNSKIQIHQQNTSIVMTEKPYPAPESNQKVIDAQGGFNASKNIRLLMRPEATARLFESISWGSKPRHQDVERAGVLVGKYYKDISRRQPVIWGDVVAIIPFDPNSVQASQTTIAIPQNAWAKMLDEFVPYLNNGFLNLGWYHTHLDFTNTRFTTIDKDTQRRYYTGEHSFAVVLNPNQKQWSVFCGPRADECVGELFATEEILVQYREPKITIQNVSGDSELRQDGTVVHRNPDGSIMNPVKSLPVIEESNSFLQSIGQLFERVGGRLNRSKNSDVNHQPSVMPPNTTTRNMAPQQSVISRQPPVVSQREQVYQPAPKITVQETDKPKITILTKDNRSETQRVVEASVYVVSVDDLSNPQRQDQDGLQIIGQNIVEVVDFIIHSNENTSQSLSTPMNADTTQNNDLTLEVRQSEGKGNTVIRISRQPYLEAFSDSLIQSYVQAIAKKLNECDDRTSYLLCVSNTPEKIKLVAIQINKEDRA